jgi:dienelactone hydrolase
VTPISMRTRSFLSLALLLSTVAFSPRSTSTDPEIVVVPSGNLRLKGFLWKPATSSPTPAVLFVHGSGDADAAHTSGLAMVDAAGKLGPIFIKHGYAFLYLCRRGQGLSADQAPFMQDLLQSEKAARGDEARKHLQFVLLTTDHLNDELAGLLFLKRLPGVDAHRIAVVGHSFGGQLTLLTAEEDSTLRAAVTFGAAAASWESSSELRERILAAVRRTAVPIMLIQAANDYSTAPGHALAEEMARAGKPYVLKIYPPFGKTADEGHDFVYTDVTDWEEDVFGFLDAHVKR